MPARGSMFDQVLGGLGRVLEQTGVAAHGKAGAGGAATEAQRAATAWLLRRTLHPRHVNWPRLLVATAAGVVLGEVLEAMADRRNGRRLPAGRSRVLPGVPGPGPGRDQDGGPRSARGARAAATEDQRAIEDEAAEAYAEIELGPRAARHPRERVPDAAARDVRRLLERAGGDLAVAAAYASVVYPRIPGPPLLRAALFGAADAAVASSGGIANALAGVSPRLRVPLRQLLSEDERRVERALALALALGLIYRDDPYDD